MSSKDEALVVAGDKLVNSARDADNFLACVATVKDGKINLEMTIHDFPNVDFLHVTALISSALSDQYRKSDPPREALPLASGLFDRLKKERNGDAMAEESD